MSSEIKILFYIIAGIIYLISTFYLKEKKKQGERNVTRKPVDTKTAEDIFRELKKSLLPPEELVIENKPEERTPNKKLRPKPESVPLIENIKQNGEKPLENTWIGEGHFEHHKTVEIKDLKDIADAKQEIDFTEMDPRKAFIYGEIFNRPRY